jgi:hypothetical protein
MTAHHLLKVSEHQAGSTEKAIANMCAAITNYLRGDFLTAYNHLQLSLALHNPQIEKGLFLTTGQDFSMLRGPI